MTKDDISRMAREAGGLPDPMIFIGAYERFAHIVASAVRNMKFTQSHWTDYEKSIVAAEREACAKACETEAKNPSCLWEEPGCWQHAAENCAVSIRARGNT